jgi:hypothetical protein
METAWTTLVDGRAHARPPTDREAKAALEWIAAHEGKTLVQLVEELHARGPRTTGAAS